MRLSRILPPAFLLLVLAAAVATADLRIPPAPDRRINDYAGALTPTERDRLEQRLVEREAGVEDRRLVRVQGALHRVHLRESRARRQPGDCNKGCLKHRAQHGRTAFVTYFTRGRSRAARGRRRCGRG